MERVLRKRQREERSRVWFIAEAVLFNAAMEGELELHEQCVQMR